MSLYDLTAVSYHVRQWVIHVPFLTYDVTDMQLIMILMILIMSMVIIDTSKSQEQYQSED